MVTKKDEEFAKAKPEPTEPAKMAKDPDKVSEDEVVNVPTFASQKLAQHKAFEDGRQQMKKHAAETAEKDEKERREVEELRVAEEKRRVEAQKKMLAEDKKRNQQ